MKSLGSKQRLFAQLFGEFLMWIYEQGYAVTFGDAYRDPRVFGQVGEKKPGSYGRSKSNHKIRLAKDLNLFKKNEAGHWQYMTETEDHRPLGEHWESMHPLCRWGGYFNDGNHYSLEHNGRQ